MIKFKNISIKNFLSYGESPTIFNFDDIGTTLIIGEDLDNTSAGTGGNGVGKSTLVNALIFGLYGKPISNISLDKLVNNINNKNMEVIVELEKDKKVITIKRCRKITGKGNYAMVFVRPIGTELNEKLHDKTPDSIGNINDFITDLIGIPYDLFVRIVAFVATHTAFLDLPVRHASQSNQSDIMEELFRLTQLSVKAESLKKEIKDSKQSLEIKIKHNEQLEKEHERHAKQIDTAKTRVADWKEENTKNIELNKKLSKEYEHIDIDNEEKLHDMVVSIDNDMTLAITEQRKVEILLVDEGTKLKEINHELKIWETQKSSLSQHIKQYKSNKDINIIHIEKEIIRLNSVDINGQISLHDDLIKHDDNIKVSTDKNDSFLSVIEDLNDTKKKNEKELKHYMDDKCPTCLQNFKGAKIKAKECEKNIINLKNEIEENVSFSNIENTIIEKLKKTKNTLLSKIKHERPDLEKMAQDINDNVKKLKTEKSETNPFTEQLKELEKEDFNDHENKITEIEDIIETLALDLDKKDIIVNNLKTKKDEIYGKISIKNITELYEIKNKITQYEIKKKELESSINPYLEPLTELEELKIEQIDMKAINDLNNLITHQNYLVKLLTKKDSFIRKTLLNKNLIFLNHRLQYYLSALGLPHKVEFTQEMTANISQFGRELDFGNLSSGQRARVNLGLSFSFRDVLQKSHDTINICMLDEVLDVGLDSVGVQNAARMLKRKARDENLALYIISHRDEVNGIFDKKMIIQMERGFSSIKMEE